MTDANRQSGEKEERIIEIEIERLRPFKEHPFQVKDDKEMFLLQESIEKYGILNPLIVRPVPDGYYEIISGHRRKHAAEKLGYRKVPVIIRVLSEDDSILSMVDSNLHRERISYSEKAFAYKLKNDVLKRKSGRKKSQVDHKKTRKRSIDIISEDCGDSPKQVQRYISLTKLIPEMLQKLDDEIISFCPAVEIAALKENEQRELLKAMDYAQAIPSLSQAQRIKQLSKEKQLRIADVVVEAPIQVNLKSIMDYDIAKDNLFIRVSSAEANKDMLANVPHQLKEDLAITYHVAVSMDEEGLSSMLIKNDLLKQYGITAEQLHEDAMKSSPRIMAPEVSSMGAIMEELVEKDLVMMSPEEREMLQESIRESAQMPTFFVVTNQQRIDGAGALFYPEVMDNLGELLGQDYFILPSSIHEMLVLPDNGEVSADELRMMVTEVNSTQVAPAERLTNDVYHFDTKDHVFEKADRFTERQKEKEAQAVKAEKAGKEQPDKKPKTKKHDMEL